MKYNLRCQYCGTDHYVNQTLLYLKLVLFGEVRHICESCMLESRYRLIGHIVHDIDETEKSVNKMINNHKKKYWIKNKEQ